MTGTPLAITGMGMPGPTKVVFAGACVALGVFLISRLFRELCRVRAARNVNDAQSPMPKCHAGNAIHRGNSGGGAVACRVFSWPEVVAISIRPSMANTVGHLLQRLRRDLPYRLPPKGSCNSAHRDCFRKEGEMVRKRRCYSRILPTKC